MGQGCSWRLRLFFAGGSDRRFGSEEKKKRKVSNLMKGTMVHCSALAREGHPRKMQRETPIQQTTRATIRSG